MTISIEVAIKQDFFIYGCSSQSHPQAGIRGTDVANNKMRLLNDHLNCYKVANSLTAISR